MKPKGTLTNFLSLRVIDSGPPALSAHFKGVCAMADKVVALVVGAGPVGLTMAMELRRYGIDLRIVDKSASRDR